MKPAGLATIPGRGETDSVLERLAAQLGIPHTGERTRACASCTGSTRDTSGVLLFAKDRAAQQHVSHQFQNNTVSKEYLAIVRGKPREAEGVVDAPLGPHPASPKRMAVLKHGGRPARTEWRVEEAFRDFAVVRCFPGPAKRIRSAYTCCTRGCRSPSTRSTTRRARVRRSASSLASSSATIDPPAGKLSAR
jgi:23S rRNA-/tRNA-specific pseudouridylate synthase